MAFFEQRLELGIKFGASYGLRFSTAIAQQSNGLEQRRIMWSQPLVLANLSFSEKRILQDKLDYLIAFHAQVKGSADGFRLKDWSDYRGICTVGTGNGTTQTWQLTKTYSVGAVSATRPITKPVEDTVTVYLDDVPTAIGWSLDYTTGLLTTELTGEITVTYDFDVPVRFEQDQIDFTFVASENGNKLFELADLTCTEIRVEPIHYPALDAIPNTLDAFNLGYDYRTAGGPAFNTAIVSTASEFEFRKSYWDSAIGTWNVGDRTLNRAELDYFIAFFRCARGQAVPFPFKDWQDETFKTVRFAEDRISFQFNAWRSSDEEVIFNLGGIGLVVVTGLLPTPVICTPKSLIFASPLSTAWSLELLDNFDGGLGEGTVANAELSVVPGGNGGGSCFQITLEWGGVGLSGVVSYWESPYFYTPSHADEILTFVYSEDHKFVSASPEAGQGQAWWLVVTQNGNNYLKLGGVTGQPSSWVTKTVSATDTELGLSVIPGVPIYFGLLRSNQSIAGLSGVYNTVQLVDNWEMRVIVTCP